MASNLNPTVCIICRTNLLGDDDVSTVGRGISTLIEYSKKYGDVELTNYLVSEPSIVRVHNTCRRAYTDKRKFDHFSSQTNDAELRCKVLRSQIVSSFNWKQHCFLCKLPCVKDERHPDRNGSEYRRVETLEIRDTVLQRCMERNDTWSHDVQSRLLVCCDLVAEEAVYHKTCHKNFCGPVRSMGKGGRPTDKSKDRVLEELCRWMEEDGESELLTLSDLEQKALDIGGGSEFYSQVWLKEKLTERYGNHIVFAEVRGRKNVICWKKMASYIINTRWYEDRKIDVDDDSERIVITAAKLLKAAIREASYSTDAYPSSTEFADVQSARSWIPRLLNSFLDHLVHSDIKKAALGHSIVQSVRPKTVISPLMLGLTVSLDHVFGGKTWLISMLHRLGFTLSYDELVRYKQSVVQCDCDDGLPPYPICYTQFVADNVDHNICTVDGLNTFHGMGIISVSTPCLMSDLPKGHYADIPIPRCPRRKVADIVRGHGIPILNYDVPHKSGLCSVSFKDWSSLTHLRCSVAPCTAQDLLWHAGWFFTTESVLRPNWSGFMHDVNAHSDLLPAADVRMMPIIDRNPNDLHCIYSTLQFISAHSTRLGIPSACITLDHPLWLKAVDIIESENLHIVCRLGPFHTMMSFLGSLGSLMAGSGLAEVMECCYGRNTVSQMLSGKAVKRAVRGHFLVDSALRILLLRHVVNQGSLEADTVGTSPESALTVDELNELNQLYTNTVRHNCNVTEVESSHCLQRLAELMCGLESDLAKKSRTASLWLQYCHYVDVLRSFIRAERMGDWARHLSSVTQMLNLFAATGHNNYAKSARLYIERMMKLSGEHPWLQTKFAHEGLHSVRRSSRMWAGLSTDLTIEQVMMKSLKSQGGLTHGRGLTDSVRLTWVKTMHKCATMHYAMAALTNIGSDDVQHADTYTSKMKRDSADLTKILTWFEANSPFDVVDPRLRSLTSGVAASDDDCINCDRAEEVGEAIMKKMDGQAYTEVVLRKCDQVKTLAQLRTVAIPTARSINIDQSVLFSRLLIILSRHQDMAPYFGYELTSVPAALFKESFMRKPNKAQLKNELLKGVTTSQAVQPDTVRIIDGGFLLHKVKWQQDLTYVDTVQLYVSYLKKFYGDPSVVIVVFDGYGNGPNIKDHEHLRRSSKCAPDVVFDQNRAVFKDQTAFLANEVNKQHFVAFLISHLQSAGYSVQQAFDDADTLVVSSALDVAKTRPVTVVANDTDILVLLVYHFSPDLHDAYFQSEVSQRACQRVTVVSVRHVCENLGVAKAEVVLAVHAFSGCDSTSALFGLGKKTVWNKLLSSVDTMSWLKLLGSVGATKEAVRSAGLKLLAVLYGGKPDIRLNHLRYTTYCHLTATSTHVVIPERLPPTEEAATCHVFRAHLQIMQWKMLTTVGFDPQEWGWRLCDGRYNPVTTDAIVAPDEILNIVRCKCRGPCATSQCSCRKHGLCCVMACKNCHGSSCNNCPTVDDDSLWNDKDDDVFEYGDEMHEEEFDDELEYFIPWTSEEIVSDM